jgi:phage terminase large subunit
VLGFEPDENQREILTDIAAGERQISIRSGHRVGKTTTLAVAITWHACTRFPQKSICTAPTSSQLFDALAAETKAWFKKLPPAILACFEVKTDAIVFLPAPEESFVSFVTSRAETPEALAGKHSENLLLICDEASGIPEPVYEAASGSMAGHRAVMILAGNPVRTSGLFFDTFHKVRDRWKTYHISSDGHPRVSRDFVEEMAARYGRDSNAFRVRVLGEFPTGDDDTIIPFELVEGALARDVEAKRVLPLWGLDCARFGADASALAKRQGNALLEPVREWRGLDTMQLVGRVKHEWDRTPKDQQPSEILVDVIGIGAGVCDRLFELGLPARGVNVSESPSLKGLDLNLRVELWFEGRSWFEKRDCTIRGDEKLLAELVQQRYKFTSSGKRQAESKEEAKKRGVKSPNRADAFLLTFAGEAVSASGGGKGKTWATPIHRTIKGLV